MTKMLIDHDLDYLNVQLALMGLAIAIQGEEYIDKQIFPQPNGKAIATAYYPSEKKRKRVPLEDQKDGTLTESEAKEKVDQLVNPLESLLQKAPINQEQFNQGLDKVSKLPQLQQLSFKGIDRNQVFDLLKKDFKNLGDHVMTILKTVGKTAKEHPIKTVAFVTGIVTYVAACGLSGGVLAVAAYEATRFLFFEARKALRREVLDKIEPKNPDRKAALAYIGLLLGLLTADTAAGVALRKYLFKYIESTPFLYAMLGSFLVVPLQGELIRSFSDPEAKKAIASLFDDILKIASDSVDLFKKQLKETKELPEELQQLVA